MKSLLVVFFGVFFALCSHGNPVFEFEEENSTSENPQQQAMKEQIGLDSAFTNLDIGIQQKYLGNEEGIMKGAENFIDSFMSRYFLTPEGKLYSNLKNAYFTLVLKFHAKKDAICAKFEEFHAFFSRNKASILNPNWMDENFDTWVGVQQAFLKETKPYFMVEGKTYQHLNQILKNNPLEMSFFSDSPSFDNYLFLFENFNFCIKWIESLGAYDDFGSILLLEKQDNLIREYRTKLDLIDGKSQNNNNNNITLFN